MVNSGTSVLLLHIVQCCSFLSVSLRFMKNTVLYMSIYLCSLPNNLLLFAVILRLFLILSNPLILSSGGFLPLCDIPPVPQGR